MQMQNLLTPSGTYLYNAGDPGAAITKLQMH
jgi:hypothetical protein